MTGSAQSITITANQGDTRVITTSYGTWGRIVEHADGRTLNETAIDALADAHFGQTDTHAILVAYREAVNAALPDSVSLCGDDFYGPAGYELVDFEGDGYPVDDDGGLDINAIICAIDFYQIAESVEAAKTSQ